MFDKKIYKKIIPLLLDGAIGGDGTYYVSKKSTDKIIKLLGHGMTERVIMCVNMEDWSDLEPEVDDIICNIINSNQALFSLYGISTDESTVPTYRGQYIFLSPRKLLDDNAL